MAEGDPARSLASQLAATDMLLNSLIEVLVSRAIIPAGIVIDLIDVCILMTEEQALSSFPSPEAKASQIGALRAHLHRMENNPPIADELQRRRNLR